jgi:hypothetical protein
MLSDDPIIDSATVDADLALVEREGPELLSEALKLCQLPKDGEKLPPVGAALRRASVEGKENIVNLSSMK